MAAVASTWSFRTTTTINATSKCLVLTPTGCWGCSSACLTTLQKHKSCSSRSLTRDDGGNVNQESEFGLCKEQLPARIYFQVTADDLTVFDDPDEATNEIPRAINSTDSEKIDVILSVSLLADINKRLFRNIKQCVGVRFQMVDELLAATCIESLCNFSHLYLWRFWTTASPTVPKQSCETQSFIIWRLGNET